jgi:hypothetical protein
VSRARNQAASKEEWAACVAEARNPAERAVLCALAKYANRTNGVVQASRKELAAAATMSFGSFKAHVAVLSARERGLVALSTLRTEHGDFDTTIYTLIGWLHLRGMNEPAHLRLGAEAEQEKGAEGWGEISPTGSDNSRPTGGSKSDSPRVLNFVPPGGVKSDPPGESDFDLGRADFAPPPNKDSYQSSTGLSSETDNSLLLLLPLPRARGGTGNLLGSAGEVVALVNHPKLDPHKQPGLVTSVHWVESWKAKGFQLSEREIAFVICDVLGRRDHRDPGADHITTWNFFTKAMRGFAAQKLAAQIEGDGHVQSVGAVAPSNAAERQRAIAGDHRASWGRIIAERRDAADGG